MKKVTSLLREYGDWHIRNMDYDGHQSTNILYRMFYEGGVQGPPARDQILCLDMPPRVKMVDKAVRSLPNWEEKCVRARFCAPLKDDGNLYTHREIAGLLKVSHYKYKIYLRNGTRKVEKLLNLDY